MILFPKAGKKCFAVVDYWERWYAVEGRIEGKHAEKGFYWFEAVEGGRVVDSRVVRRRELFRSMRKARSDVYRRNNRRRAWR